MALTAQTPVYFPASQFGEAHLRMPQNVIIQESSFNAVPNFEPVVDFTASNRYRRLSQPVGRLDILIEHRTTGEQKVSVCTATLLSESAILTNYHCIPGTNPDYRPVASVLRMNYLTSSTEGTVYRVGLMPIEAREDLDYAVLSVAGNPAAQFGTVTLRVRDPQPSEELFIIHHPAGMTKRITRRNCRLSDSPQAVHGTELRHRCDTKGGSSGSLIFSDNNEGATFYLVGLHYAGFAEPSPDAFNSAKRLTEIVRQSPFLSRLAGRPTPSPQPVLVDPSRLFGDGTPRPAPNAHPINATIAEQSLFAQSFRQLANAGALGFMTMQNNTESLPHFPLFGSNTSEYCAIANASGSGGIVPAKTAHCRLGGSGNYATVQTLTRAQLQALGATVIADDDRGIAARFGSGVTFCLDPRKGSVSNMVSGSGAFNPNLYITFNSPNVASAACFVNAPIQF
ncbi:MAG: hypothetical protein RhofKO_40620 [Rhodothermales bacterium]